MLHTKDGQTTTLTYAPALEGVKKVFTSRPSQGGGWPVRQPWGQPPVGDGRSPS